jgi:hypothetical protein
MHVHPAGASTEVSLGTGLQEVKPPAGRPREGLREWYSEG